MLIDERIGELTERGAKAILRKAIGNIAERQTCGSCVMQIVCGEEASADKCMCNTLNMFSLLAKASAGEEPEKAKEPEDGRTILYDPETMRLVD